MNSMYGVLGLPVFRFYDLDNAEATTLTGQSLIKFSKKITNHFYNKELGDTKDHVIYIDTDSIFASAVPLIQKRFPNLPKNLINASWSGIVCRSRNSSQIFERIQNNIFVAGCYNGSGIGVGTLFGEQIAIKASNEHTKEIETIEARNKPTWLPPQPFLDLGIKTRLLYERIKARSEI